MVPTRYGHQAIRFEFEGLIASIMRALIDSNKGWSVKSCCVYCGGCLYILTSPVVSLFEWHS